MRALVSVSNKTGLVEFFTGLQSVCNERWEKLGFLHVISTGGTYEKLHEGAYFNNLEKVSDVTGQPEILDGRVKTLHPKIHGGLLALNTEGHIRQLRENSIERIDLLVVNLYPFEKTVANPDVTLEEAIEQIDIGGPAMLRAAAKNYTQVVVLVDPGDYWRILDEYQQTGAISLETRQYLALKVFEHTSSYDTVIKDFLTQRGFARNQTIGKE